MRIDVVQIFHRQPRAGQRLAHRLNRPVAGGMRVGDAIAAERIAIAGQLGVDVGAAFPGGVPFLEHQESGTFAEDEAVARRIEWAAGSVGLIIVRRECAQQAEARKPDGVQHRVVAAGEDVIGEPAAHHL